MALMPAPPIPTMWMRWGVRRSSPASWRSAGMGVDQLGHRGGGIGVPQASRRRAHGGQPVGIGEQRRQFGLQPGRACTRRRAPGSPPRLPRGPRRCASDGRVAPPAAGPGWPGGRRPAARPPSWPRPDIRTRRRRGTGRASDLRRAPPGTPGLRARRAPSRTGHPGLVDRELRIVTPARHVVQRQIPAVGPARRQLRHGGVDATGPQRAAERGQVRRSSGRPSSALARRRPAGDRSSPPSSGRTGVPVTTARGRSVPGKATALTAANRPSSPLTAPGTASGFTRTMGTRVSRAATPAGKLA